MTKLGVKINPSRLQVTTAAQGSPLEVVGTVANLVMAVSPTNLLKLMNVVVYRNLGHRPNLGLNFCHQFKTKLDYEGDRPCIQIRGESYSLLNSAAAEEREEAREQPRDLEQAQHGQNHICCKNRQMSTLWRFKGLGVKSSPAVTITNMSNSVFWGRLVVLRKRKYVWQLCKQGKH